MADRSVSFVLPTLVGGGAESVVLAVADRAVARVAEVEVVSLLDPPQRSGRTPGGVLVTALGASRVRSALVPLLRHIRTRRPDAVLTTLKHVSTAVALLRPLLPPHRHVARVANTYSEELAALTPRRRSLERRLLKVSHRRIHHFVCVSAGVREDLLAVTGVSAERCTVIMNPVDVDELVARADDAPPVALRPEIAAAAIRYLSIGRLEPQKDHRSLLAAFAMLPRELDAALVVIGSGSLSDELLELARELDVVDRVQFTGFIANPYPLFRRCDALVMSSRYEGLPNVILEALALGLRCVSTDCPSGPAEILVDESLGLLVPVADPEALASAMVQVVLSAHDPLAGPRHVRAAHSPDVVAALYEAVLADGG